MYRIYTENYTVLMKEIKDLKKLRDIPCSWMGRLNTVKIVNSLQNDRSLTQSLYGNLFQYPCLKILWTEKPVGYSPVGHKELEMTE